ncbi:tRNA-splicing endonuclease subunit Sen2-like [Argonauta hians]
MSQTMVVKIPVPRKKKRRRGDLNTTAPPSLGFGKYRKLGYYCGKLQGKHVVVNHSGDAYDLYTKGCFGKGSLSRSLPEFQALQPVINIPKDNELIQLNVMKLSRYLSHRQWKKCASKGDFSVLDEDGDDDDGGGGVSDEDAKDENCDVTTKPPISDAGTKCLENLPESSQDTSRCSLGQADRNPCPPHPLCKNDEDKADTFVVDPHQRQVGEEEEEEGEKRRARRCRRWLPTMKKDPYSVEEVLLLTYEEAFFLSYGLGCLFVRDEQGNPLKLSELWKTLYQRRPDFLPKYVAYHYYRSQGWIPKPGLKFGSEYILYKEGQLYYHATYSVLVSLLQAGSLQEDLQWHPRSLDWITLAGLDRMSENVSKQLMLCHVIKPKDITDEELLSPNCITRFQVQEMLLSRWISSQDREKKNEKTPEEFP